MKNLALVVVTTVTFAAQAFEAGEPVYAKIEHGSWLTAKYSAVRTDCFVTEHPKTKLQVLRAPSELVEGKIEAGAEVGIRFKLRRETKTVAHRVLSAGQTCHAVERGGLQYARASEVLSAAAFTKLIGSKKELSVGSHVYAVTQASPYERWGRGEIVSKREDCYETDTGTVLHGDDVGDLRFPPGAVTQIKAGDTVLVAPSFRTDALVAMKVKAMSGGELVVAVPHPDAEGEHEEKAKAADAKAMPTALSAADFAALKPQAKVLQYTEPAACDSPYYQPLTIVSAKRVCHIAQLASGASARVAERLIPADALP